MPSLLIYESFSGFHSQDKHNASYIYEKGRYLCPICKFNKKIYTYIHIIITRKTFSAEGAKFIQNSLSLHF